MSKGVMSLLEEVRQPLVDEALRSPALLSDLAGLERYVAESYDARSFVELLQNADDAGAERFVIRRSGDFLLVANDGHHFTRVEFESLCRSAASSKHRGTSIGYRGIGFKSVVGFAEVVHVLSGELEATFSRERTAREILQARRVPLIRIPHPLETEDRTKFGVAVERLLSDGFKTVFVFAGLIASAIEAEFAAFDATALLFLRNVCSVNISGAAESVITLDRETRKSGFQSLHLTCRAGKTLWSVMERDEIALAFLHDESSIVPMKGEQAVVHAFLPTHEPTGFPFKLNGDISTDPSRTRIVQDERTAAVVKTAAQFIIELLERLILGSGDARLMSALIPVSDPRMAGFQRRSFRTDFYAAIQRAGRGKFEDVFCRPTWLNAADFDKLAKASGVKSIPRKFDSVEGLPGLLKFLGGKEATFENIAPALKGTAPSVTGAAEIAAHLTTLFSTRQVEPQSINPAWKLWSVGKRVVSLDEVKQERTSFDDGFVEAAVEKVGSPTELRRFITALTDKVTAAKLIPGGDAADAPGSGGTQAPKLNPQISLKRWRSAEQQVLSVLTALSWKVEDVSRQNIGYDIEGRTPEGKDAFVEVKAIEYPGQAFTLTSNEEAVARQKGNAYRLALVRQTGEYLEVAFIEDPVHNVKLTRQCRLWLWECQRMISTRSVSRSSESGLFCETGR
ncbi:MAG: DUF3883 domain-containing protein [Verrucomicrobia bacterium]|nr:DUF3883 domain-containing protein [Verrucomicrobiota bacterium]